MCGWYQSFTMKSDVCLLLPARSARPLCLGKKTVQNKRTCGQKKVETLARLHKQLHIHLFGMKSDPHIRGWKRNRTRNRCVRIWGEKVERSSVDAFLGVGGFLCIYCALRRWRMSHNGCEIVLFTVIKLLQISRKEWMFKYESCKCSREMKLYESNKTCAMSRRLPYTDCFPLLSFFSLTWMIIDRELEFR